MTRLNEQLKMSGLSNEEIEVVNWLIDGVFLESDINKQVIRSIYRKIGIQNKTQLYVWSMPYKLFK